MIMGGGLCGACRSQVYNPAKNIRIEKDTKEYKKALISYRLRRWPEQFKSRREEQTHATRK
jgi:hypothetical protein